MLEVVWKVYVLCPSGRWAQVAATRIETEARDLKHFWRDEMDRRVRIDRITE
jgi:hypothetical protein